MTGRQAGLLLTGLVGTLVLIGLGIWQVQRLQWKTEVLATITARLEDAPVPLPATVDPVADNYRAVTLSGAQDGPGLRVWSPPAYRLVVPFLMDDGRRVMLDRGLSAGTPVLGHVSVTGNLNWPDDVDSFTPAPDGDVWYARDVAGMAKVLGTEPVLVVARSDTGQGVEPLPVTTSGIPNNHLQYAVTWFSLAAIWAGMTLFALWRIRRGTS